MAVLVITFYWKIHCWPYILYFPDSQKLLTEAGIVVGASLFHNCSLRTVFYAKKDLGLHIIPTQAFYVEYIP